MADRRQKRVRAPPAERKSHTVHRSDKDMVNMADPANVWRQCSSIEGRRGCDMTEHCEWIQRKGGTVEGYCGLDLGRTAEWIQGRCAVGSLPMNVVEAMVADLQQLGALPRVDYGHEREQLCETIALGLVAHAMLREHGGNAREIDEDIRQAQRGWSSWLPTAAAQKTLNDKRREAFRMLEDYRAERELDEGRPLTLRELVPDFVEKLREVSPSRLWLWAVGGTALVALAAYLASRRGKTGVELPIVPPSESSPTEEAPLPVNEEMLDVDGNPLPEMMPYQEEGFGWKVPAAIGGGALLGALFKIDPAEAEEFRKKSRELDESKAALDRQRQQEEDERQRQEKERANARKKENSNVQNLRKELETQRDQLEWEREFIPKTFDVKVGPKHFVGELEETTPEELEAARIDQLVEEKLLQKEFNSLKKQIAPFEKAETEKKARNNRILQALNQIRFL